MKLWQPQKTECYKKQIYVAFFGSMSLISAVILHGQKTFAAKWYTRNVFQKCSMELQIKLLYFITTMRRRTHSSFLQWLTDKKVKAIENLPYSPYPSMCYFDYVLGGQNSLSEDEIDAADHNHFTAIPKEDYFKSAFSMRIYMWLPLHRWCSKKSKYTLHEGKAGTDYKPNFLVSKSAQELVY